MKLWAQPKELPKPDMAVSTCNPSTQDQQKFKVIFTTEEVEGLSFPGCDTETCFLVHESVGKVLLRAVARDGSRGACYCWGASLRTVL